MSWLALRRIVEAFFRRWPFYVTLLIGALTFGVLNASRTVDEYSATGSVFVDSDSLVTTQSGVQDGGPFSFLTPAQFTAQELNGLISTEAFMDAVVERAGVELNSEPSLRASQINGLRRSITSFATSENLVAVSVTTFDPELSFRLANSVIDEFVQFQINIDIAESGASEDFFSELVEGYRQDLIDARDEVDAALRGVADLEELEPDRALELERLQADEALASERFWTALQNVEASRLATLQTETDVRQSYSVFDPPAIPTDPNGGLLDDLILLAVFGLAGVVLAMIGPVTSAMLNRTVQFTEDLEDTAEVPVVAVLPRINAKQLRLEGAVVTDSGGEWGASGEGLGRRTITFLPDEDQIDADLQVGDAGLSQSSAPKIVTPPAPATSAPAETKVEAAAATEPAETSETEASDTSAATGPKAASAWPGATPAASDGAADETTEEPSDGDDPNATRTIVGPAPLRPPKDAEPPSASGSAHRDPSDDELGQGVRAVESGGSTTASDHADDEDVPEHLRDLLATTDLGGQTPGQPPLPPPGSGPSAANGEPTRQSRV